MFLVAGCNGHVGREIVIKAAAAGEQVRCFDLDPFQAEGIDTSRLDIFTGDITDPASVRKAVQGVDTVMFAIGLKKQRKDLTHEMVEHGGIRNVIEAFGQSGSVRRIIYISALGVGGDVPATSLVAKWRAEQSLIGH